MPAFANTPAYAMPPSPEARRRQIGVPAVDADVPLEAPR